MRIPSRPLCRAVMAPVVALAAAVLLVGGASAAPSCQDVLDYLRADAEDRGGTVQRWGVPGPLVVRATKGSPKLSESDVDFAVWLLNKELPKDSQLQISESPELRRGLGPPLGTIKVAYLRREDWPKRKGWPEVEPGSPGYTLTWRDYAGRVTSSLVLIDHTRATEERERIYILLHEMLHALGRGHVSRHRFPDTIMAETAHRDDIAFLKSLDKAALRAVYGRLPIGTKGYALKCNSQGRIEASR